MKMLVVKVDILLLILIAFAIIVEPSTCASTENSKLEELIERFNSFETTIQAENAELKADVKQLQFKLTEKDQEIQLLNNQISKLSPGPSKWTSSQEIKNDEGPSPRASPPSSCEELARIGYNLDGLYLVSNQETKKIETVFCEFLPANMINQELIGNVEIKTRSVHFYVQRFTSFVPSDSVIPWEVEKLNVGEAMNLASGYFTAPVDGVYHIEFSGMKDGSTNH